MNNKFDELTKQMAQSVTRRAALKKFGACLVAAIAAALGISTAFAAPKPKGCKPSGRACSDNSECCSGYCYITGFDKRNMPIFTCA